MRRDLEPQAESQKDPPSTSESSFPLLQARAIGRQAAEHQLLRDVSLSIHLADRVALVGPSGSGKTLLLRALALLDPIDSGEILWRGGPVAGGDTPRFRSRVMYLHQQPTLLEGSVEENLRQPFSLAIHHEKRFDPTRVVALLRSLGRDDSFLRKRQQDLSGGEAQLTALLRAMQLDPELLLLDEPTSALDQAATEMVEQLIAHWLGERPQDRATVWVSHDEQQARRVADTICRLHDGRLEGGG